MGTTLIFVGLEMCDGSWKLSDLIEGTRQIASVPSEEGGPIYAQALVGGTGQGVATV
jgi:hypothetical protein